MTKQKKIKLILDTDPGIDDAIAILMAINNSQIDLLGITTVFGNSGIELVTLTLCVRLAHTLKFNVQQLHYIFTLFIIVFRIFFSEQLS